MSDVRQFAIGSQAVCQDGPCGRLRRVIVDPAMKTVTHLVVEPKRYPGFGRLVPVELVEADDHRIRLGCTRAELDKFAAAEETEYLPAGTAGSCTQDEVLTWPYYSVGGAVAGSEGDFGAELAYTAIRDVVPSGEVEVRGGDCVHATDGNIGRVQGFVVNPDNHRVTHILLAQGHLWSRKEVAIAVADVRSINAGIQLRLSKRQVTQLPRLAFDHDHRAGPEEGPGRPGGRSVRASQGSVRAGSGLAGAGSGRAGEGSVRAGGPQNAGGVGSVRPGGPRHATGVARTRREAVRARPGR